VTRRTVGHVAIRSRQLRAIPHPPITIFIKHPSVKQHQAVSKLPKPSNASSIDEAQALVRRCAEPRPVGDKAKAAILRASRRLEFAFTRTKDIWYGDAKRIDAKEMDRLRQVAQQAELALAVGAIEALRSRMLSSRSAASRQVVAGLGAALLALGSSAEDGPGQ
jgi:hypothetical protein